jgi:hypothetical protein
MIRTLLSLAISGLAGVLALGLVAMNGPANAAGDTDAYVKRVDRSSDLVTVDGDDDDEDDETATNSGTGTGAGNGTAGTNSVTVGQTGTDTGTNTGSSNSTDDGTGSRLTAVSREDDASRGDLTKDFTTDGGDRTRDLTPNLTNDQSRNDTRG